jgi:hypothetical protein
MGAIVKFQIPFHFHNNVQPKVNMPKKFNRMSSKILTFIQKVHILIYLQPNN